MKTALRNFLNDGKHLPYFLKDFHDQKDVFKLLGHFVNTDENHKKEYMPNWVSAHIYTIDFFLWNMARCGYTLQKNKTRIEFDDIHKLIDDFKNSL